MGADQERSGEVGRSSVLGEIPPWVTVALEVVKYDHNDSGVTQAARDVLKQYFQTESRLMHPGSSTGDFGGLSGFAQPMTHPSKLPLSQPGIPPKVQACIELLDTRTGAPVDLRDQAVSILAEYFNTPGFY